MAIKVLHIQKVTGISGSEKHLLTLLSRLDPLKYQPEFLMLEEPARPVERYVELLTQAKVPVHRMAIRSHADPTLVWRLARFLRKHRFQLVHTHLLHADLYGTAAAKLGGVPTICSTRHNDDPFRNRWPLQWLTRAAVHSHSAVVTISQHLHDFCIKTEGIPARKLVTIPYGIDPPTVQENGRLNPFKQTPATIVLGAVGRLTQQKGYRYLIEALPRVLPSLPDLVLVLVGEGELRAELDRLAKRLQLADRVIFTGYRPDAPKLMHHMDIFLLPSLWEGFGLVLLEAMAAARPIIASRVSAVPEIVEDGVTGLLVKPRDSQALAQAILRLASSPDEAREMGLAGRRRLEEKFTVEAMVSRTEALYSRLIG